jgi:hypothetical protein
MAGRLNRLAGVGLLPGTFASSADAFDAAINIKPVAKTPIVITPSVTKPVVPKAIARNSDDDGDVTRR